MASALDRLQAWYLDQCDEVWEQANVITMETIDNPGWRLTIDLAGTRWSGRDFPPVQRDTAEHDWLRCWVKGTRWEAAAGPCSLEDAVCVFLDWVGADDQPAPRGTQVDQLIKQRWTDRQALARSTDEEPDE